MQRVLIAVACGMLTVTAVAQKKGAAPAADTSKSCAANAAQRYCR